MDNKTLAQIIQNNIRVKNLEAESGSGDIVIYNNASGAYKIEDIALEIGAVYEIFITSAVDTITDVQYGQQIITLKLIPGETTPNNYDFYVIVNWLDVDSDDQYSTIMNIYNYDTELWTIDSGFPYIKIYKVVKKAV